VGAVVFLYVIVSGILTMLYLSWIKRKAVSGAAAGARTS
jgi:hypothetical protein